MASTAYISIDVRGIAEAAAGLETLGGELLGFSPTTFVGQEVHRAVDDVMDVAVVAARAAAPYATGQLRSSVGRDFSTEAPATTGLTARLSADPRNARAQVAFEAAQVFGSRTPRRAKVNYGWFTERGTTRIPAQHWFEQSVLPILQAAEARVLDAIRVGVARALRAKSLFLPL